MDRYQVNNLSEPSTNFDTPLSALLPNRNPIKKMNPEKKEPTSLGQTYISDDAQSGVKLLRLVRAFNPGEIHLLGHTPALVREALAQTLPLANLREYTEELSNQALDRILKGQGKPLILIQPSYRATEQLLARLLDQNLTLPLKKGLVIFIGCLFAAEEFTLPAVQAVFTSQLLPRLNPLFCHDLCAAPYWEAGFFLGGQNTAPFLKWANQCKASLIFEPGLNFAGFFCGTKPGQALSASAKGAEQQILAWTHNPTLFDQANDQDPGPALQSLRQGARLFAENNLNKAKEAFFRAQQADPELPGINLALAICLARQKEYAQALEMLSREGCNTPGAQALSQLLKQHATSPAPAAPPGPEPENAQTAALYGEHKILVDKRALDMGGSWTNEKGVAQAYEKDLIAFFHEQAQAHREPVILDIGSNTGSFCLLPALDPAMRAYAFEPQPKVREVLKSNIRLNRLQDKVKTSGLALAHEKGECILKQPTDQSNTGLACLGAPVRFDEWEEITVPVSTLDLACRELAIPRAHLIKIDTEGCELFVLMGGEEFIRTWRPGILVEYYAPNTAQFGYKPEKIVELLDSWGYKKPLEVSDSDLFFPSPIK